MKNFLDFFIEYKGNYGKIQDMNFLIEIEQEIDGRFIAEIPDLPGVLAYGATKEEAIIKVEILALFSK